MKVTPILPVYYAKLNKYKTPVQKKPRRQRPDKLVVG